MKNKLPHKLLSVILTIAICATSILGCVIAVNAAESATYTISSEKIEKEATQVTLQLAFNAPQGMASVSFVVDNSDGWYNAVSVGFDSATAVDGTVLSEADGFVITSEQIEGADDFLVIIEQQASVNDAICATLVLELTFTFDSLTAAQEVTISDIVACDIYGDEITFTGTGGTINVGCDHEYEVSGTPVYADDANGYEVYSTAACVICGETKDGYQVVPVADDDITAVSFGGAKTEVALLDATQANSESNPYIINDPGQLFALSRGLLTTSDGTSVGKSGEYFKVADGIDAFYLNGGETVANLTSADEVKSYFEASGGSKWWSNGTSNAFNGHFDGNGVVISGLYSATDNAGLFPFVDGNTTIKNLTLKNSYISASNSMGVAAIVGITGNNDTHTVAIENVTVANNYIAQTHATSNLGASAIMGYCYGADAVQLNNCLVYGNIISNAYTGTDLRSGLVTYSSGGSANMKTQNIVALGVTPWTLNGGWNQNHIDTGMFVNIFTDQDIQPLLDFATSQNTKNNAAKYNINGNIDPADMLGANAATTTAELTAANKAYRENVGGLLLGADLDWNTSDNTDGIWYVGKDGEYPSLLKGFAPDAAATTDFDWSLLATNIQYEDNGSYSLNFHYLAPYESDDLALYVPKSTTKTGFIKLTESVASPFAGGALPEGAKMFTIPQLSARDIETLWLPTIMTTSADGSEIVYSKTEPMSIADVALSVISGEAYYDDTATETEKQADINVAAAVLNYSAAVQNISNVAPDEGIVSEYTNKPDTEFADGDGSVDNPYIIETADQFAAVARGYVESEGKYFKVADGVRAFYINGGEKVANMTSAAEVKAYFTANPGRVWWTPGSDSVSEYFKGNFDGNGVTIYGLYAGSVATGNAQESAALFPKTGAGAVIKNITLKNSYIEGSVAGGIVARGFDTSDSGYKLTLENIAVVNNYIYCTNTASASWGGIVYAYTGNYAAEVTNCVVYGNDASYANYTTEMPVFSYSNASMLNKFYYIVSIGHSLEGNSWHTKAIDNGMYQWVYSDRIDENTNYSSGKYNAQYNITVLEKEQMLGSVAKANMPLLDWSSIWAYGAEGQPPVLALRSGSTEKKAVTWGSGYDDDFITDDGVGSGTEDNPYIISTGQQLASVCAARIKDADGNTVDTAGLYFKVADNIGAFYMNGGETVANMTSVDDVKTYFEANGGNAWWCSGLFKGNFDGNGAVVYGLYACKEGAGLFQYLGANAVIKNITVKNSYIKASNNTTATYAGGIAGQVEYYSGISNSNKTTIENCGVINTYIDNTHLSGNQDAGVITSLTREHQVIVDNFLAYGNEVVSSSGNPAALIGNTWSGTNQISNVVSIGARPYSVAAQTNGCKPGVFTNVYTDVDLTAGESLGGTYAENQIKQITDAQAKGPHADDYMPNLAWNDIWYTGGVGDYPAFVKAGVMPSSVQAIYDAMVLDNYDTYGVGTDEFGVYATSLTLKTNPYIGFTFAFHKEYRENRDKITVTFTTSDGETYTTVPETDGVLNENWVNNEGAVRYHLYRFKDVPVKYLCDDIKVTVNYGGKDYDFGTFSAEGFALNAMNANAQVPCDYYTSRAEAAKALLFYSQMLQARYGA